jgi:hypothetical protein
MDKTMRERMMRAKQCTNCGLTDENGGVDFAGSGLYWYCQEHLEQRDEAALLPSQRVS